ncbi:ad-003, putative [Entamoeba invadens IP1]|uniref:ad-003, putative n=1 Tax=Entamoeba invadens IP1 TaxID=370355 RepID=UPI0002C3EC37|nr:ad-003, putative [Entamoeba invadens IP1]ELP90776.1 ad-003, putative [Entamoeba invadens IP1]|eukprot:XP_004257547.1 ad-003, putative [Entamoeba invadens IP1]
MEFSGVDSLNNHYNDINQVYQLVDPVSWYALDKAVWDNMESSNSGMVDGYVKLIPIDESNSHVFLRGALIKLNCGIDDCLDLGGGVGRVTKDVLSRYFKRIDVADQCVSHVNKAKEMKGVVPSFNDAFVCNMQHLVLTKQYDCIWIQWSILYLRDEDLVNMLQVCKAHLKEGGIIVVKENIGTTEFYWDRKDNSLMRTITHMNHLFVKAGLGLLQTRKDLNYPTNFFPLYAFILQ